MKICLVRCPSPFLIDEYYFPPLGLVAVGTMLRLRGHNVCLYDDDPEDLPADFDGYGWGPTTPEYPVALAMLQYIKNINKNARCIIGGSHATLYPTECLKDGFDAVVMGDGEIVGNEAFSAIDGLHVGAEIPLSQYPLLDRSLLDLHKYHYKLENRPCTTVMTGRGCPYKCAFCAKTYQSVRLRSVDSVVVELRELWEKYGYDAIAFPEDLFILDKNRAELICRELRYLQILWRCLVRGDLIAKYGNGFVYKMAESGCVEVGMGVESGSDRILKNVNKKETIGEIRTGIKSLKDHGIRVKGYFIVGLPGESPETLDETRRFLDEMNLDDVDIKIFQPYPGSPIWENPKAYDVVWDAGQSMKDMYYKGRPGEYRGSIRTSKLTTDAIYKEWVSLESTYKRVGVACQT